MYDCIYLERLDQHRGVLEEFMECQYGLLDHLRVELTCQQYEDVKEHITNRCKQNDALLNLMCSEADSQMCEAFLEALRTTHQKHLAAYVQFDGGMNCMLLTL